MSRPARILLHTLLTVLQVAAFSALFLFGGAWAEIRLGMEFSAMQQHKPAPAMIPLWIFHLRPTFDYVANGLIFALVLLLLLLIFEAARKRLHPWASLTVLAFVLAFGYSLLRHSGFVPISTP